MYRLGAVVIRKNRIVGKGFNSTKTHPMLHRLGYHSTHAECDAMMHASEGDTLIVVRVLKNGKLTCAKPCKDCLIFAKQYGIKKIVYSDWDESIKEIKIKN
jgi:deoxycytidylate deaminase